MKMPVRPRGVAFVAEDVAFDVVVRSPLSHR
jgi:hypothetical protein